MNKLDRAAKKKPRLVKAGTLTMKQLEKMWIELSRTEDRPTHYYDHTGIHKIK